LGLKRPPLGKQFCEVLDAQLGLEQSLLSDAWRGIDCHISWLAGTLAVYREQTASNMQERDFFGSHRHQSTPKPAGGGLISSSNRPARWGLSSAKSFRR
jgi:hypothetical protein